MMKLFYAFIVTTMILLSNVAEAQDDAAARGKNVFEHWCVACHGKGPGKPGTIALQAKYKGILPALLEERSDLTPELVDYFVRNGVSVMPFFRKTEIGDADLVNLSTYLTCANKCR